MQLFKIIFSPACGGNQKPSNVINIITKNINIIFNKTRVRGRTKYRCNNNCSIRRRYSRKR